MKKISKIMLSFILVLCSVFIMFGCDSSNNSSNTTKNNEVKQFLTVYGNCVKAGVTYTPWTTTYNSEATLNISIKPTHSNLVFKNTYVYMNIYFYVPIYLIDNTKSHSEGQESRVGSILDIHTVEVVIKLNSAGNGTCKKTVDAYTFHPEISTSFQQTLWFYFSSNSASLNYEITNVKGECYFV